MLLNEVVDGERLGGRGRDHTPATRELPLFKNNLP